MKVFTKWVAEALEKRGFKYDTEQHRTLPRYKVFIFEDTPQFQKAFLEVTKSRNAK
ncbi:MAG: hypothetical protein WAM95_06085 [Bacillus sp. (in: firmicutes)]